MCFDIKKHTLISGDNTGPSEPDHGKGNETEDLIKSPTLGRRKATSIGSILPRVQEHTSRNDINEIRSCYTTSQVGTTCQICTLHFFFSFKTQVPTSKELSPHIGIIHSETSEHFLFLYKKQNKPKRYEFKVFKYCNKYINQ